MARSWSFPPFRLDLGTGSLWRDDTWVPLPPKAFTVLATLVAQAGQVVTKEALFDAAWPDTAVTDGVLKGCIRQIRRALGERAGMASSIATVHRRGYRFCLPVTPVEGPLSGAAPEGRVAAIGPRAPSSVVATSPSGLVGREAELAQLQQWWAQACQGRRQVVFITGEAGIGKTTLVDAFVAQMAATAVVWSARGQCIEHYGAGEPYLPLLEALGQWGRGPDGAQLVALLHQSAPTWLVHLPALVPAADYEAVQRRAGRATRERMLRELAEAVEGLTAARPLLLVLEDLALERSGDAGLAGVCGAAAGGGAALGAGDLSAGGGGDAGPSGAAGDAGVAAAWPGRGGALGVVGGAGGGGVSDAAFGGGSASSKPGAGAAAAHRGQSAVSRHGGG